MAVPGAPTIFLFTPFTTIARITASPFIFGGSHEDTEYQITDTTTGDTVAQATTGSPDIHVTIPTVNLMAGRIYRARLRYSNSEGFGNWSKNFIARVPSELDLPAITIGGEPRANQVAPIPPDFIAEVEHFRDFHEHLFETDHVFRRVTDVQDRRTVRLTWVHLDEATFVSLRDFILGLLDLDPPEGFYTPDSIIGSIAFFPRQSRIQSLMTAPDVYTLSCEADEIFQERPFTVAVSSIAGPDAIL